MELLEYQAKELFDQIGIPVLPSQRIQQPRDLKGLKIPYPVVLKSQVYTGGRGKAGGIRFVENTIDAMAAAQAIFHLPIMGRYPEVLLAEAKYNADREFYLAVVLDSSTRRPMLLGSPCGGEAVEANLKQMQQVIVEQDFSPFCARRLAIKMGLTGELIQTVAAIIEKMYYLFIQKDLDLIEINPLAVSSTGELMALDGKVTMNDAALGRHLKLVETLPEPSEYLSEYADSPVEPVAISELDFVSLKGNIGVLCNGAGLLMATLDLLYQAKGKPAGFVDVGGEYRYGWSFVALQERIQKGLELIEQQEGPTVVLVNIISGVVSCLQVAEAIAGYLKQQFRDTAFPPLVVRLTGEQFPEAQVLLAEMNVSVLDSLDDAIAKTIALAKSPAK
ncbi:MAG: ADP-forming succinate--CoA ligase subunit beta [Elainellaceae cyanobacterium]